MFGVKESEGAKWFQSGQKELKETKLVQLELEIVEGSKIRYIKMCQNKDEG